MNLSALLVILASSATAMTIGLWSHIKSLATRALTHAVVINHLSDDLGAVVITHLSNTRNRSKFGERFFTSSSMFVRPLNRRRRIAFRLFNHSTQIYWVGWRPIWVTGPAANSSSARRDAPEFPITISYLRGTLDWDKTLSQALQAEDNFNTQHLTTPARYRIERICGSPTRNRNPDPNDDVPPDSHHPFDGGIPLDYPWADLGPAQSGKALDFLSLSPELDTLTNEIRFWHSSGQWYRERGIPWRRGYLFHGAPGTGKTSYARALAEELDLPVFVFDLASLQNDEFNSAWSRVLSQMPCMVLFEDIDAVFQGRKNITEHKNGLTFDLLLNCLDGIEQPLGLLLIISTNNIQSIDPALASPSETIASRPGRIDRSIEFRPLDHNGRLKMATRITQNPSLAQELADSNPDDSAAQFQERCFRVALANRFKSPAP